MNKSKSLCVVGASGLVGSSIVRCALEKGYVVNGTLRDKNNDEKIKYLKNLPNGKNLILYSANMTNELDFSEPLEGVDAVFIACLIPVYKGFDGTLAKELDYERGYKEIITPTVEGCLNILRVANKQGVKNVIICSSTSSTNPILPVKLKNEVDHWSNEDFQCKERKFTSATKTVMEKAAFEFCDKNKDREVVVYANTSAKVKSISDWVVTSSIAVPLIEHLTSLNKKLIWAPDKYLGSYGDISTFSFHETKNISCGEGGLLVINNKNLFT